MKTASAEQTARNLIASRTTSDLIRDFIQTGKTDADYIYTVRGWIMDELESRNPEAFEKWIDESAEDEDLWSYFC